MVNTLLEAVKSYSLGASLLTVMVQSGTANESQ